MQSQDPYRWVGLTYFFVAVITSTGMMVAAWMFGFSVMGVACLTAGFSGFWWWRFASWSRRGPTIEKSRRGKSTPQLLTWIRWLCITAGAAFGLLAAFMLIMIVPKGMHGAPLGIALLGTFIFSSIIGGLCTEPWRKPRAIFGVTASLSMSIFTLQWTGAAQNHAWYDIKGGVVSNWLLVQSLIDHEMNRARTLTGYPLNPRDLIRTVTSDKSRAERELETGDYLDAEQPIERAVVWAESRKGIDRDVLAGLWLVRAKVRSRIGQRELALEDLGKVIQHARQQGSSGRSVLIDGLSERARVRSESTEWREAELDLSESISIATEEPPSTRADLLTRRAQIRSRLGDSALAKMDANDAIGIVNTIPSMDPVRHADTLRILSKVFGESGDVPAAVATANEALNLATGNGASASHQRASAYMVRARAYLIGKNAVDAEQDLTFAIDAFESLGALHSHETSLALSKRAEAREMLGSYDTALDDISRAINVLSVENGECDACVAEWRALRARILHRMQRWEEAKIDIHAAIDWMETHKPNSPYLDKLRGLRDRIDDALMGTRGD